MRYYFYNCEYPFPDLNMSAYFQFETEFIESMRCIPMGVRCKLDTCGVKLKLAEWSKFSKEEREQLFEMPCFSVDEISKYRYYLQGLVQQYTSALPDDLSIETNPVWLRSDEIPTSLQEKAQTLQVSLSLAQWQALDPLQRFALIKLSTPSHESKNFPYALREFGLMP